MDGDFDLSTLSLKAFVIGILGMILGMLVTVGLSYIVSRAALYGYDKLECAMGWRNEEEEELKPCSWERGEHEHWF